MAWRSTRKHREILISTQVGAASTLSRRVRALGSLVTRCAHDAADAPSIQALLDAGVPEALRRACEDADDSDDGVDAASEAVQAASVLLRALPSSAVWKSTIESGYHGDKCVGRPKFDFHTGPRLHQQRAIAS